VGCNNTCTFCIVPHLRGKERDRRPGEILAEVEALVAAGAVEVTLLGQNVNSYGVEFGDRGAFAKLLRACGQIEGLERVRFTSPHPAAFTDDVIAAMAETPNVMPQLHMPLQSGSDRVLRAMRRSYRSARFLGILERVREAIPDAAITTDIIVGFPGETEEDFLETMRVVEASRFSSAFMFQYSPRPGTPAATMEGQLPKEVVQERFERLLALQERISAEEADKQVGRTLEVLVAEGSGKKDGETRRLSGRAPDNRLVHFALPAGTLPEAAAEAPASLADPRLGPVADLDPRLPRPGDMVTVEVTRAAPHFLVADSPAAGGTFRVRRTRSGDAWAARETARLGGGEEHGHGHGAAPAGPVTLGMPSLRR
jgi:tRNA-2-methylthio-N6-dimethylallyladenosine synthase